MRSEYECKWCGHKYLDGGFAGPMIMNCPRCGEDLYYNRQCNKCKHQIKMKLLKNGMCGLKPVGKMNRESRELYSCDAVNPKENCQSFKET